VELHFINNALRKRWWILAVFVLGGVVLASRLGGGAGSEFTSTSLVLVQPSVESVSPSLANQPDRYVQSQITVLESTSLADRVASTLGEPETSLTVRRSVEFSQREDSDIVEVVATTSDASRSQRIAQAYADAYLNEVTARTDAVFQPERDRLSAELAAVEAELVEVNADLQRAAAPYLATLGTDTPVAVPDIRVLDPDAATRQTLLLSDLARIESQLDAVNLTASQAVQTELVQRAQLPTEPLATNTSLLRIALVFIMTMLGVVAALVAARFSPTVIDVTDIERELQQPIEATLPRIKNLTYGPEAALRETSSAYTAGLDRLVGRLELASTVVGARVVLVGGSQDGAGSTTAAIGLAARFARRGNRTVLIDGDDQHAALTGALDAPAGSLSDVAAAIPPELGATDLPNLITLGTSPTLSTRRLDGEAVVAALRPVADIVVIDVGPVLESMTAAALARAADQIVLVLPESGQRHDGVAQVARVFDSIRERLIPVIADVPRVKGLKNRPTTAPDAATVETMPEREVLEDAA
jgi:capsular polysaccharide biosynthesis protein/cellulose biosynthesis protein BcsQ